MVQVVNWGDLMVQDLHGETCIRKIWVPVPFVNISMEYYSPLLLLYICFNMGQCAAAAFVNIFKEEYSPMNILYIYFKTGAAAAFVNIFKMLKFMISK